MPKVAMAEFLLAIIGVVNASRGAGKPQVNLKPRPRPSRPPLRSIWDHHARAATIFFFRAELDKGPAEGPYPPPPPEHVGDEPAVKTSRDFTAE